MAQMAKSTMYYLWGFLNLRRRNPGTVRVSTEDSKAAVILGRYAIFRPATAEFRFMDLGMVCRLRPSCLC